MRCSFCIFLLWIALPACVSRDPYVPPVQDPIRVMIIDAGLDAEHPLIKPYVDRKNSVGLGKPDTFTEYLASGQPYVVVGHGTHVTGLALYGRSIHRGYPVGVCDRVKIILCNKIENTTDCLRLAKRLKVRYVNISGGGSNFITSEKEALVNLVESGAKVTVAAGNEGHDIDKKPYYPASYRITGVIVVGNGSGLNNRAPTSNYGIRMVWEDGQHVISTYPGNNFSSMSGTSMSAPIYLNKILRYQCKTGRK